MDHGLIEKQKEELDRDFASLTEWINGLLGVKLQKNLIDLIPDGVLLCKIVNAIRPGTIRSFHQSPSNIARKMENIGFFITACQRRFEISSSQLFEPASVQFLSSTKFNPASIGTLQAIASVLTSLRRFTGDLDQKYSPRHSTPKPTSTPAPHQELCTQTAIIEEILSVIHHELSYKHQQALANKILDQVNELQKKLLVLSDAEIKEFAHKAGILDCDNDTRAECIEKILMCRELIPKLWEFSPLIFSDI